MVTKLECPSSLLMVSTSTPASNMPVAKLCLRTCGLMTFVIPAKAAAILQAFWIVADERGTS